jgi:hypothetical protein
MQAALDLPDERQGLYLQYPRWCEADSLVAVLRYLGIEVSAEQVAPLLRVDAKHPQRIFTPDRAAKRAAADAHVPAAAQTLDPLFDQPSRLAASGVRAR